MSVLLPPLMSSPAASLSTSDTLLALARQTSHLQQQLQSLLDAQSVGLSAGLGHAPPTPRPSSSSSRSPSSRGPSHERQAAAAPPSLASARSGIHTTLLSLARTKAAEHAALSRSLATHETFLAGAQRLADKKAGLEEQIAQLEKDDGAGGEATQLRELADEEMRLERETRALEEELAVKRARLRDVRVRREQGRNRHEARLSSWRDALREVDRAVVEEVLDGRGLEESVRVGRRARGSAKERESVWGLPRDRRTLELVKEEVAKEVGGLKGLMEGAEEEGEACVEGAESWKGVVRVVREVEGALRKEVGKLSGGGSPRKGKRESMSSEESGSAANGTAEQGMEAVLQRMGETTTQLEEAFQHAEEKSWTLLICAIGAELEALREGREMLEKAFGLSQVTLDGLSIGDADNQSNDAGDKGKGKATYVSDQSTADDESNRRPADLVNLSNHEEDEPSSDLLFSRDDDE